MAFCQKCGKQYEESEVSCSGCGNKFQVAKQEQAKQIVHDVAEKSEGVFSKWKKVIFPSLGLVVLIIFIIGGSKIGAGASDMMNLRSQSGNSVAEAYYQYSGAVYSGIAAAVYGLGLFFASTLVWLGFKK